MLIVISNRTLWLSIPSWITLGIGRAISIVPFYSDMHRIAKWVLSIPLLLSHYPLVSVPLLLSHYPLVSVPFCSILGFRNVVHFSVIQLCCLGNRLYISYFSPCGCGLTLICWVTADTVMCKTALPPPNPKGEKTVADRNWILFCCIFWPLYCLEALSHSCATKTYQVFMHLCCTYE